MTTTFEPTQVGTTWLCPCQDAYSSAAHLLKSWVPRDSEDPAVENYACDQNGDRWQHVRIENGYHWQYLGRPNQG